jgi:hypothetical protein
VTDITDLIGIRIVDPHGYKVGKVEAIFGRHGGEKACWARVKTGLLSHSFVPLQDAQPVDGQLRLVYEKEHVKAAPAVKPEDGRRISDDDADLLSRHYGLERITAITVQEDDIELPRETREAKPPDLSELPPAYERHPIP